ncbi:MAG: hypothetical protein Ct9H90mP14_1220 [Methanobacteriota archaeon]|nr:MAG: hypothetical protein Ct9H90mP14_1220 [Euryarchaeota archaeon]
MRKAHEYVEVALPGITPSLEKMPLKLVRSHASAVIKAMKKGIFGLADRVYSGFPAQDYGLQQIIRIGHMRGRSNIIWWLEQNGYEQMMI